MSVMSVKIGDNKHYGNEGRHTREGVYLPKRPNQSTMHRGGQQNSLLSQTHIVQR